MPRIIVTDRRGQTRHLDAVDGSTILEVARRFDLELEGTCGGQMACATCHVVIGPDWYARLPPPSNEERDMLELAARPRRTSRLGCQVRLAGTLDGLAFEVIGE